ncbi:hypothetical protein GCM10028819_33300 [Spirosoma humi]
MGKIDQKKIVGALKQLENAAKAGIKALNEATDNSLADSIYAEFPLQSVGMIGNLLQKLSDEATMLATYEGLTEEQIAEKKAVEEAAELEQLQQLNQERLAELTTPKPEPVPEPEKELTDDTETV